MRARPRRTAMCEQGRPDDSAPRHRREQALHFRRIAVRDLHLGEEITIVSLVCQDLAESDEIAAVIRSVGPTVMFTVLLDGPQLASRWAARYASVFADDPGSVVLT